MVRSMTAFASHELAAEGFLLTWELRSVNHRYLDVGLRLPESFKFLEPDIRTAIAEPIKRGKIEANLTYHKIEGKEALKINLNLAEQLIRAAHEVESLMGTAAAFTALDIINWPGVLETAELDRDKLKPVIIAALQAALKTLLSAREREGRQLAKLIRERTAAMQAQVTRVRQRRPQVLQSIREKISARVAEIMADFDRDRLEQELVYWAQRLDVDEELDRLEAHLAEAERVLKQDAPAGRRLDFLMQELNRETNTLAAKAADAETTQASVEMKVLIEQMREQVQNIE